MTVFADASALVKLYAEEEGDEHVHALDEPIVASQLSRVEVPSALWRKQRMGELSTDDASLLAAEFEYDWYGRTDQPPKFAIVRIGTTVLDNASRLVAVHGLRAGDGIQLASARAASEAFGLDGVVAFDTALRDAAAAEGFALVPRR